MAYVCMTMMNRDVETGMSKWECRNGRVEMGVSKWAYTQEVKGIYIRHLGFP